VKKFAQLILPDNSEEENLQIAEKLMKIYFTENVKHPAKSTIQR
jgi:hypothetical protein